mgnify:CR=1 FL=1
MTKEELETLYKSCVIKDDFNYNKYEEIIINHDGAWFKYSEEDRRDTYDKAMIDYMKKQGFLVYDDPYSRNSCCVIGWVVFPPIR